MVQFGTAIEKDLSPSIDVLHDLQTKGLPLDVFWTRLETIRCQRALNVFRAASEYIWCAYTYMYVHCLIRAEYYTLHLYVN